MSFLEYKKILLYCYNDGLWDIYFYKKNHADDRMTMMITILKQGSLLV